LEYKLESEERTLSIEEANKLVEEHRGWAESIARSVARAWSLDWQLDGLDGAAMEALVFCSRRFNPDRGIPFRGYARRRVHESSTEAARKSRGWRKSQSTTSEEDQKVHELSMGILNIFPEIRSGYLPYSEDGYSSDEGNMRGAIRNVLVSTALLSTSQGVQQPIQEDYVDYKKTIRIVSELENLHQHLIYEVYWEGKSLRQVAAEWHTEALNVIREHQILLAFLEKSLNSAKGRISYPKIRPGLKAVAIRMKDDQPAFLKLDL
jgi:DNA-directed RNA polymerase specialized sigma subunit